MQLTRRRKILLALLVPAGLWAGFVAVRSANIDPIIGFWHSPEFAETLTVSAEGRIERIESFTNDDDLLAVSVTIYQWTRHRSPPQLTYRITHESGATGEACLTDEGSILILKFPGDDPAKPAGVYGRLEASNWYQWFQDRWFEAQIWWDGTFN